MDILSAINGELGSWRLGIRLGKDERRKLNLTLKKAISIEGTLLMLDDATPHVAVPVQAIRNGKVIDTALSDEGGKYRFINLKPGRYQVRCQVLKGYVYYRATDYALRFTFYDLQATRKDAGEILSVEQGKTLKNIDFRFPPFKKGTWKTYTALDGLASSIVGAIHRDPDGVMWLGTFDSGVSRYDGKSPPLEKGIPLCKRGAGGICEIVVYPRKLPASITGHGFDIVNHREDAAASRFKNHVAVVHDVAHVKQAWFNLFKFIAQTVR